VLASFSANRSMNFFETLSESGSRARRQRFYWTGHGLTVSQLLINLRKKLGILLTISFYSSNLSSAPINEGRHFLAIYLSLSGLLLCGRLLVGPKMPPVFFPVFSLFMILLCPILFAPSTPDPPPQKAQDPQI